MSETVRWHLLGAGAIGTLLTHQFRQAGIETTLLHHRGAVERLLVTDTGRHRIGAEALGEQAHAGIRHLLLCTKAGQVAPALAAAMPRLHPDAVIATTANGLGLESALSGLPAAAPLFRAHSTEAAYRDDAGTVVHAGAGHTHMGCPGRIMDRPRWFERSLQRLARWQWDTAIDAGLARKFSINCAINALTASFRCLNGELLTDAHYHQAFTALCSESEKALRQLRLWQDSESLQQVATAVCRSTAANRSSMLQDVLAGRPTELPFLNAELLRRAAELDLRLPLNESLVASLS